VPPGAVFPSHIREIVVSPLDSLLRDRDLAQRSRLALVAFVRGFTRVCSVSMLAVLVLVGACAPKVSAGAWECPADGGASNGGATSGGASQAPAQTDAFWSTGFEDASDPLGERADLADLGVERFASFCDYTKVKGYCYGDQPYVVVTEPHHSGRFAAEFNVVGDQQNQTRCVSQGVFPTAMFFGAWYYIPEALTYVKSAWNLWHFQSGDDANSLHDLWDVSLGKGAQDGTWELFVLDRPSGFVNYYGANHTPVPIGSWFHIELFLKRASDSTGEIALYQDGVKLFDQVNLKSDASKFTQWYVGDWADMPKPQNSSLFVDDITISATLSSTSATP
jgi:hypothetical protein